MKTRSLQLAACGLSVLALFCWVVMFLAGTDVWHDVGSPDVWTLPQVPYPDVRAGLYAFYVLFVVLVGTVAVTLLGIARGRGATGER